MPLTQFGYISIDELKSFLKGAPHPHAGRPGKRGGSAPGRGPLGLKNGQTYKPHELPALRASLEKAGYVNHNPVYPHAPAFEQGRGLWRHQDHNDHQIVMTHNYQKNEMTGKVMRQPKLESTKPTKEEAHANSLDAIVVDHTKPMEHRIRAFKKLQRLGYAPSGPATEKQIRRMTASMTGVDK